jgi:hypothetical protein
MHDRPRRKKVSPLRIERASMLGRKRHNNGQGERTHFIKMEREKMMAKEKETAFATSEEHVHPQDALQQRGKRESTMAREKGREIQQKAKRKHTLGMCCNKSKERKKERWPQGEREIW